MVNIDFLRILEMVSVGSNTIPRNAGGMEETVLNSTRSIPIAQWINLFGLEIICVTKNTMAITQKNVDMMVEIANNLK